MKNIKELKDLNNFLENTNKSLYDMEIQEMQQLNKLIKRFLKAN